MAVETKQPKSFFSTTAGLITGVAGVLTAVVGIVGAATQLGWLGSKGGSADKTTTTLAGTTPTTAGSGLGGLLTGPGSSSGSGPTSPSQVTASPTSVNFDQLSKQEAVVRATNGGKSKVALSVSVGGANASSFAATPVDSSCNNLLPGASCDIKVTFKPSSAGSFTAKLVISAGGAVTEVALQGSRIL